MPFVLMLMTPVSDYFAQIFSFPIRLKLSDLAGRIMQAFRLDVQIAGNMLSFRGHTFSVDPACLGLHMLTGSLLAALLFMNYFQSRENRRLPPGWLTGILLLTLVLVIIANLLRIILLVLLLVEPDNPMHGILGIMCWLLYVIIPLLAVIRRTIGRYGEVQVLAGGSAEPADRVGAEGTIAEAVDLDRSATRVTARPRWLLLGNMSAALAVLAVVIGHIGHQAAAPLIYPNEKAPAGYTLKQTGPVLQLNNAQSLVYIKPIPDFYYTDHTPMICWQGSGYHFKALQFQNIGNVQVFEGILEKGDQQLYTAWWYDNGGRQTTDGLDWRWDVLRGGSPYSVVNVTSTSHPILEQEVAKILHTHPFTPLISRQRN